MTALASYRVLELAESPAGEYCGKLLADFGAEVIKVERPGKGSPTRHLGPFAAGAARDAGPECSGLFAYLNTNKQSLTLDLDSDEGRGTLNGLLARVDVVIDDHRPGWLEDLGLDAETCQQWHGGLVVCAITPYGRLGPDEGAAAEDINVFHSSGWGYHTPSAADEALPPLNGAGRFLASYEAGLEGALCVVSALFEREASGLGQFIDISQQAVLAGRTDYVLGQMVAGDMPVGKERTAFDLAGPAGIFPCADGFVYIWMSAPGHWSALGKLMGEPAWMRDFPEHWLERECTPERVALCRRHLGEWLSAQCKAEVSARAQKLGLTMVAVNHAGDLLACEQYAHRGFFQTIRHPVLGEAVYPTAPYRMSETPVTVSSAAPLLGEHNHRLASWLVDRAERKGASQSGVRAALPASSGRGGPLQGLRVVELTKVWAGPYVGKLLAFLGAEVIRVESLGSLDVTRSFGVSDINNAPGFQAVNPQKLSVQIDMKTPRGIELLRDLLAQADVVVENLRPGAIERLGLGYPAVRTVKPDIVYVSMGMYGNTGPLSYQTGYAPCFVALGGVSALVGYEGQAPAGMNVRYADSTFGTAAAYATVVALLHRRLTGSGQFIDVSAVETMSSMIGDVIMDYSLNGHVAQCVGNRSPDMAPHGVYPCRDGDWLSLAVPSDTAWAALAAAMGRSGLASDARFANKDARLLHSAELDELVAAWTVRHGAAELEDLLRPLGVAVAKSQSSLDLIADARLWAREFFREVKGPGGEARAIVGPSWRMTRGARIVDGAPHLGQHNDYVLADILGLDADIRRELIEAGVVR